MTCGAQQDYGARFQRPELGCGVGLRTEHYETILAEWPKVNWFEAISENFMDSGGRPLFVLEQVRERYPVALHGVALSIGSADPLNRDYLKRLKSLVYRIQPVIVSDHVCWAGVDGENLHDLLPLPFTEEAVSLVAARAAQVQDFLGRRILLENASTYITFKHSEMTEWEFISAIAKRSGCGILLDVNNVFVNATNHGFDALEYIRSMPKNYVEQIHLAGHTNMGKFLFDTHSAEVTDCVWSLYREALRHLGPVATLIERDENIPPFHELMEEVRRAEQIFNEEAGIKSAAGNAPVRAQAQTAGVRL